MYKEAASPWKSILWGVTRLLGATTFGAMNAQGAVNEYRKTKTAIGEGNTKSALGHGLLTAANAALVPVMAGSALRNATVLKAYPHSHALNEEARKLGNVFGGKSFDEAVKDASKAGLERKPRFTKGTAFLEQLGDQGKLPQQLHGPLKEYYKKLNLYKSTDQAINEVADRYTPNILQKFHSKKNDALNKIPLLGMPLSVAITAAPFIAGEALTKDEAPSGYIDSKAS